MSDNLFIGTKTLYAWPMNRADYNEYRGWDLPADEDGTDEGYLVEYADGGASNHPKHLGYVSWSPKAVFEAAYRPAHDLGFGAAIAAAKQGRRVARSGWNGKNMWAYVVPQHEHDGHTHNEHWLLVGADGTISTWAPSGSDSLASDWMILP